VQKTRQRILDFLERRGTASAKQMAKAFGMTSANLRHHLSILLSEHHIHAIGKLPSQGQGRPETVFAIEQTRSTDLEALARSVLKTLDSSESDPILKKIAANILGKTEFSTGSTTQHLVNVVHLLQPLGYKPSWEARPQGPQVVLGRCPYASIISDHPELCQIDAHMLEAILASPVMQTAKLQPGPQRIPQCIFTLAKSKSI
jgi:predicted ArsR family transcriptional regulator